MAYIIFETNNTPVRIAQDQNDLAVLGNYKLYQNGLSGKIVTIPNEDFLALQNDEKHILGLNGEQVVYETNNSTVIANESEMKQAIEMCINETKTRHYNSSSSLYTKQQNYLNALQSIDTSSITYPLNQSVNQYLISQGISVLHPLQLM